MGDRPGKPRAPEKPRLAGVSEAGERQQAVKSTPLWNFISSQIYQEALERFEAGKGSALVYTSEQSCWLFRGELNTGRGEL